MCAQPPLSSTVQAWELGVRLREHRMQLGLKAAAAAKTVGVVAPNFSMMEAGRRRISQDKLAELADLYELSAGERAELEELREQADQRSWWHDYRDFYSDEFLRFIGLEAGASAIRAYSGEVVPELLQIADYARATVRAASPYIPAVEVGPRVESRLVRQGRLSGDDPLQLSVLLAEGALRQQVGGPAIMARQIEHLLDVGAEGRNVKIRVWPFARGAHPLLRGPVEILTFPSDRLPDLVWQETALTGTLIDKRHTVETAKISFEEAYEQAPDEVESREIMRVIGEEMKLPGLRRSAT